MTSIQLVAPVTRSTLREALQRIRSLRPWENLNDCEEMNALPDHAWHRCWERHINERTIDLTLPVGQLWIQPSLNASMTRFRTRTLYLSLEPTRTLTARDRELVLAYLSRILRAYSRRYWEYDATQLFECDHIRATCVRR